MPSADELRDEQLAAWAALSRSWEKWDSIIIDQLRPVGAEMIERLDITEGHQHLDIASGTGAPGLSIASLAPKGRVVLTDLVAEMLDVAERRAGAQGIANIETQVCSADDLSFTNATFDGVTVRFGYMLFPDVAKATAEFARVLKPGGRLCSRYGSSPRKTRGRRSPCKQSLPRRCWRRPTGTGRICFGADGKVRVPGVARASWERNGTRAPRFHATAPRPLMLG